MSASQPERRTGYDIAGPMQATRIILIHGAAWTRVQWLPQMLALADEYRMIALDLPGHGARATEPFRLETAMQTVARVIDETDDAAGGGGALVVGHSLGGYVAMALASAQPRRVAGLVVAGSGVDYRVLGRLSALDAALSLRLYGERRIQAMQERTVRESLPADLAEAEIAAGFSFRALPAVYRELARRDFRALLRTYPGPTLILNGERDRANRRSEARQVAACQRGRRALIAGAGHLCNLEQPEAFTAQVRAQAQALTAR